MSLRSILSCCLLRMILKSQAFILTLVCHIAVEAEVLDTRGFTRHFTYLVISWEFIYSNYFCHPLAYYLESCCPPLNAIKLIDQSIVDFLYRLDPALWGSTLGTPYPVEDAGVPFLVMTPWDSGAFFPCHLPLLIFSSSALFLLPHKHPLRCHRSDFPIAALLSRLR